MSSTQTENEHAVGTLAPATVDLKLEVINIPVSDVARAKGFYEKLGWRLDADFSNGPNWRVVQMTPPGSPCSIHFGTGVTTAAPGSVQNSYLVVSDIEAARQDLISRGAQVSEVFHFESIGGAPKPGIDPERRTYMSYASFSDPDGNSWLLQEITTRFPGRGFSNLDVATLTELLREAEEGHTTNGSKVPEHHWSQWYAAYIASREEGKTSEDAVTAAAHHIDAMRR